MTQKKKRYAIVGAGGRITMFSDPIARDYRDEAELVGLCDISSVRMNYHRERLKSEYGYPEVPTYPAAEFDRMVAEQKPDVVVVCSVDATHHEYIVRALDLGCDVITEKPMTIDDEKCRAILDAVARTGRHVRVTFNYRWAPAATKVREVIASGAIGNVKHVDLEYMLDTSHGADYFRRWHSYKDKSGGLLVHKATHHFDLVNWWLDAIPSEVFAYGGLVFYGKKNALNRGDEALTRYDRYTGTDSKDDPFRLALDDDGSLKALYLDAEEETGYLRDENVFRDGINIEDTMSALVKYRDGTVLNYSLNAYCPVEGIKVVFNGDRGRLEYTKMEGSHIIAGQSDTQLAEDQEKGDHEVSIRVRPHFKPAYDVEIPSGKGAHGGADPLIQEQIFSSSAPEEHLRRNAGAEQGAASILIGIAANKSMVTGQPMRIEDLVTLKPEAVHLSELV